MRNLRLYPQVTVKKQSFEGEKILTVPNQSLTLKEILKRFVRREALPIEQEGVYHEGDHDLEKVANEDIVVRYELLEEQRQKVRDLKKRLNEQEEKSRAEAYAKEQARKAKASKAESAAGDQSAPDAGAKSAREPDSDS